MLQRLIPLLSIAALLAPGSTRATAAIVYESATLGPIGQVGGYSIDEDQFLGSRFSLASTTTITAVGGHLEGDGGTSIFAAIIAVRAGSLPAFAPDRIESFALASTLLAPPDESADVLVPLSITLGPGDYALVFGGGRFGATGDGAMPTVNADTAAGSGSYFLSGRSSGPGSLWGEARFGGLRFVVIGQPAIVPEPSSLALCGMAGLAGLGRRGWRKATRNSR